MKSLFKNAKTIMRRSSVGISRDIDTGEWLVRTTEGCKLDTFLQKHNGSIISKLICRTIIGFGKITGIYQWVEAEPLDSYSSL